MITMSISIFKRKLDKLREKLFLLNGKALYGLKLHKTEKRERRNKKENKK